MFVVATCAIGFLLTWDCINLCMMYYTKGCCNCECYHLNFSLQIASCKLTFSPNFHLFCLQDKIFVF
jgi:hypothetical protein